MDVVVYGAEKVPSGFRVVKNVEELRRHLGRAFIIVVGDRGWRGSWGLRIFRRRSERTSCDMRESTTSERFDLYTPDWFLLGEFRLYRSVSERGAASCAASTRRCWRRET
jgi:hypothetical protein